MANYSQQEGTSLSLALQSSRDRFQVQMAAMRESLFDKDHDKKTEQTLQKIVSDAIKTTCMMVQFRYARTPGPDGPRVVSAELFARELIVAVWNEYRTEIKQSLRCFCRPDPLPEDSWFKEPLSPEHAEYVKKLAQSAFAKGGAPVEAQKMVTPETSQFQVPVVLPKKPASVGKEETSKSQTPVPHPENMKKAGKETSNSQSDQESTVPSEKSNATRLKWSDEAMAYDKKYTSSCRQNYEQSIADTKVEPRTVDTFFQHR